MAILEVQDLCAGYENAHVIHDITFSLNRGELLSVLGRNGSGKSTLVKSLQGLLNNVSGRIRVEGIDLFSLKPQQVATQIGYVPQMFDYAFDFTVKEVIEMGRYVHQNPWRGNSAEDSRVIEEVLELTETTQLKAKKIGHLSGGERQRVFIARALAQDTPLLFLDEPSSHLDINYQVEIYGILQRLREEKGKTILATEHNINLAIPYSQRVLFLKKGRIHALGPPEKLITKDNIREVFHAEVDIRQNPHSGLPEISLIPRLDLR